MIKSAEADVNRFLSLFRTATQDNINTFIPWNPWIAMIPAKHLIQRQNGVLTSLKSIILSGFKNIEDIPLNYSTKLMDTSIMADDDDATPAELDEKYGNVTVNEFIKTNYKDIDDCDKENYASSGNQFKCIKQKTDSFGDICP
jgi:hypothetical protein